jgi:aquaporin Z
MRDLWAEFFGTFVLVFAITSAIVGASTFNGNLFYLAVPLVAGFTLTALIYAFGRLSGGHFNPAVTLALVVGKRFPQSKAPAYLLAQVAGGAAASLLLLAMAGPGSLGATTPGGFGSGAALLAEIAATAIFAMVILSVTAKKSNAQDHAGLTIGLTLAAAHFAFIPFSGASLNPARSIGPAVLSGGAALSSIWIYLAGPLIGAWLGAYLYGKLLAD